MKFGTDASNEMLLNAAKYQGYSFYTVSELLRENQQSGMEGGVKLHPHLD